MTLDDVVAGLLAERYAPSKWWPTPKAESTDDEMTLARRRRELKEAA
jgi:hypothetical protein